MGFLTAIPSLILTQLTQRATELHHLSCALPIPRASSLFTLPAKLKEAHFALYTQLSVAHIHSIFTVLNGLSCLKHLSLDLPGGVPADLHFALFHPPSLTALCIWVLAEPVLNLTAEQVETFRSPFFANLDELSLPCLATDRWLSLLRTPHALRWKTIAQVSHGPETMAADVKALAGLAPSLTTLSLSPAHGLAMLPQLRCLTHLNVVTRNHAPEAWTISADTILAEFECPSLTKLDLQAPLTSKHLAELVPRMPLLKDLHLYGMKELESLAFLSRCAAAQSCLTSLSISNCRHPSLHSSELVHLLGLKSLTDLWLSGSCLEPLDCLGVALFTPPSAAFPMPAGFVTSGGTETEMTVRNAIR